MKIVYKYYPEYIKETIEDIMANKKSTQQTNSIDNEQHISHRSSLDEKLFFQILIKRQSHFYSKWKKRNVTILYHPFDTLTMTIKVKDKKEDEEVVDLKTVKLSKRCSVVQGHHCFGFELDNGKRYIMGRQSETKTLVMFDNVTRLKKYIKEHRHVQNTNALTSQKPKKQKEHELDNKLLFEKSNCQELGFQVDEEEEMPIKNVKQVLIEQKMQYQVGQNRMIQEEQQDLDEYCTVLEDQPSFFEQKQKLHLKLPIQQEQMNYLQSDQDFKLRQHFAQGRILQKSGQFIKSNLLLKTHLTHKELLQSFFHFQLWNSKIKKYQLMNRIDEGIYLVYVQFHKMSLFSSVKYCYMMATSIIIDEELYLIFKSLERTAFEPVQGCEWIDISLWAKLRGADQNSGQMFLSVCMKIGQPNNYSLGLLVMQQLKRYQAFLLTTNKLPHPLLEWRELDISE